MFFSYSSENRSKGNHEETFFFETHRKTELTLLLHGIEDKDT